MNSHGPAGTEIWLPSTSRNNGFNNDFYVPWGFPDQVRNVSSLQLRCRAGSSYPSPQVAAMGIRQIEKPQLFGFIEKLSPEEKRDP